MIIFDNIIFSLQKAGGISVVWQNIIKNLLILTNDINFLENPNTDNIFRQELNIPSRLIIKQKLYPIVSQLIHPKINIDYPFIFHSSYFRTCNNPNAINITTVHDFIYEQGKPSFKQKIRIKLNYNAIKKSDAIICISENTKYDLLKFLPEIDKNKIHVIHNGVSEDYYRLIDKPYSEYKDFILFVGGRQSYKNFDYIVKSLVNTRYKLLICGKPLSEQEMKLLNDNIPNQYTSIRFPTNEELNKIYNSVYALVYPSSYEGFGIPILEAQRAGCPVIALNSSSIPEVIGSTPLLLNELSTKELINKLNLLDDEDIRIKIIENGISNSKRFSWEKTTQEYFNLYNKLIKARIRIQEKTLG